MKIYLLFFLIISCNSSVEFVAKEQIQEEKKTEEQIDYFIAKYEDLAKSFFSVEVDWDKKIIYAGSTSGTECLTLISYDDIDNIQQIAEVTNSSPLTQLYGACRNLKLYDNYSKLLVNANNSNRLLRYDLGSTPEDPTSWGTTANFLASGGSYTREIQHAVVSGSTTQVYFSTHTGWFHVELDETLSSFTEIAKYTSMSSNNTAIFDLHNDLVMAQRYSSTTSDISILELADGSVSTVASGSLANATGFANNIWTSFSSEDGTKHAIMGQMITFIDSSSGTPIVTRREKIPSNGYRASKYIRYNTKDYLYAVTGSHILDVYDVTDMSDPKLLTRTQITEMGSQESYGIDVNMDLNLAVLGTHTGTIGLIDLRGLHTPTENNIFIPEISITDSTVGNTESSGSVDITLSLNGPTTVDVDVYFETIDGSATSGSDYTASSGSLTFAAGESIKTINIPLVNDGSGEGTESFTIQISSPVNGVIVDNQATISFSD